MTTQKTIAENLARMNRRYGLKLTANWQTGVGGMILWNDERELSPRRDSKSLLLWLRGFEEALELIQDGKFQATALR